MIPALAPTTQGALMTGSSARDARDEFVRLALEEVDADYVDVARRS